MSAGDDLADIEVLYPVLPKCPFCKGKSSPNYHLGRCWVECHDCGARGPKFTMKFDDAKPGFQKAIMGWEIGAGA